MFYQELRDEDCKHAVVHLNLPDDCVQTKSAPKFSKRCKVTTIVTITLLFATIVSVAVICKYFFNIDFWPAESGPTVAPELTFVLPKVPFIQFSNVTFIDDKCQKLNNSQQLSLQQPHSKIMIHMSRFKTNIQLNGACFDDMRLNQILMKNPDTTVRVINYTTEMTDLNIGNNNRVSQTILADLVFIDLHNTHKSNNTLKIHANVSNLTQSNDNNHHHQTTMQQLATLNNGANMELYNATISKSDALVLFRGQGLLNQNAFDNKLWVNLTIESEKKISYVMFGNDIDTTESFINAMLPLDKVDHVVHVAKAGFRFVMEKFLPKIEEVKIDAKSHHDHGDINIGNTNISFSSKYYWNYEAEIKPTFDLIKDTDFGQFLVHFMGIDIDENMQLKCEGQDFVTSNNWDCEWSLKETLSISIFTDINLDNILILKHHTFNISMEFEYDTKTTSFTFEPVLSLTTVGNLNLFGRTFNITAQFIGGMESKVGIHHSYKLKKPHNMNIANLKPFFEAKFYLSAQCLIEIPKHEKPFNPFEQWGIDLFTMYDIQFGVYAFLEYEKSGLSSMTNEKGVLLDMRSNFTYLGSKRNVTMIGGYPIDPRNFGMSTYFDKISFLQFIQHISDPNTTTNSTWDIELTKVYLSASLTDFDIPGPSTVSIRRGFAFEAHLNLFNLFEAGGLIYIKPSKASIGKYEESEHKSSKQLLEDIDLEIKAGIEIDIAQLNRLLKGISHDFSNALQNAKKSLHSKLEDALSSVEKWKNQVDNDIENDANYVDNVLDDAKPGGHGLIAVAIANETDIINVTDIANGGGSSRKLNDFFDDVADGIIDGAEIVDRAAHEVAKGIVDAGVAVVEAHLKQAQELTKAIEFAIDFIDRMQQIVLGGTLFELDYLKLIIDVKLLEKFGVDFEISGLILGQKFDCKFKMDNGVQDVKQFIVDKKMHELHQSVDSFTDSNTHVADELHGFFGNATHDA